MAFQVSSRRHNKFYCALEQVTAPAQKALAYSCTSAHTSALKMAKASLLPLLGTTCQRKHKAGAGWTVYLSLSLTPGQLQGLAEHQAPTVLPLHCD
jgi:hypothetical protein